MAKIKKIKIGNIFRISLLLFIVYVIYQLIRSLLGGSWGFEELVVALLVANIGYSFETSRRFSDRLSALSGKLSEHLGAHKGYGNGYRTGKAEQ